MVKFNTLQAPHCAGGYKYEKRNRKPEELTQPSQNVRFTEQGEARTRKGYSATTIDIGVPNTPFIAKDVTRHNATFFAGGSKVKYYDWSAKETYDTGLSLTEPTTSLEEFQGDLYCINATDGLQHIVGAQLIADASSGASSLFIEIDAVARLSAFGYTSGTIRIKDTAYDYTAIDINTGELTLSGTTSAAYSIGDIVTHAISRGSVVSGTKLVFWNRSMNVIGRDFGVGDVPKYSLFYSEFANNDDLSKIMSFSANQNEIVGSSGVLKNAVPTKNYLYLFTENETWNIFVGDVNIQDGSRPPQIFSRLYGTVNGDSVAVMDDQVVWLTQNKRIIRSNIRLEDGTASLDVDTNFDNDVIELLKQADDDQSEARVYYLTKSKELHVKVSIKGAMVELVYDNNLGRWCPPDTNKFFNDVFERSGEAYGLSDNDDTVYKIDEGYSDDGADIECIIAFGEFEGQDSRTTFDLKEMEVSGSVVFGTNIMYTPIMNYSDGTSHNISYTATTDIDADAIAEEAVALFVVGGSATIEEEREFDARLGNYPSRVRSFQPIFKTTGEDVGFSIKSWSVPRKEFNKFISTAQ